MEMADLYCLYRRVTLKIMSISPTSNQIFSRLQQCIHASWVKIPPPVESIAQGNPFWIFQNAGVTLKVRSRSSKSNQLFPFSKQFIYASLVKIHTLVQKITHRNHIMDILKCPCDLEN